MHFFPSLPGLFLVFSTFIFSFFLQTSAEACWHKFATGRFCDGPH